MESTRILSHEHRIIETVLTCLERLAERGLEGGRLDGGSAREALDFLRRFADRCHHGKEENLLFAALLEKGMPREGGPIAVMLEEHDEGRSYIRKMTESLDAAEQGEAPALGEFASAAQAYVSLLRAHIEKEDLILYPMTERFLDAEDETRLMRAFETFERDDMGAGAHEELLSIARRLAAKLEVPEGAVLNSGGHHSH